MTTPEHAGVVADESAQERRYAAELSEKVRSSKRLGGGSVNNTFTASVEVSGDESGEFVGRVAFPEPQQYLDGATDFYVGTAHYQGDGYVVYNWTTPVAACTYYRQTGRDSTLRALSESVRSVRVFARAAAHISDFEDEGLVDGDERDYFPVRGLQVPRAPGRAPRPDVGERSPKSADPAPSQPPEPAAPLAPVLVPAAMPNAVAKASPPSVPGPALRTPELLRRQLAAPKAVSMASVLSTLQTDQYEAIAKPASETQFLQGHPGTGKTIIAAHRAAFLLNAELPVEARPRGEVLIIGPTDEYVNHISAALSRLIDRPDRYSVKSIPALLDQFASTPPSAAPTQSLTYSDVSPDLARLVDKAFARTKAQATGDSRPTRETVYAALIEFLHDPPPPALDSEWVLYLRDPELPRSFGELKRQRLRRYRGLMAYIGVVVDGRGNQIGHMIVDEAQDIHPIEWEVLGRLGNTGGWTILGDLNQRRTDHTYPSWDGVALALALEDEHGHAPVTVLERGYRSTSQIIRFANQLLRREDRPLYSLQQDGEEPRICRVPSKSALIQVAVDEAEALSRRVGAGTTAVIGMDSEALRRNLLHRAWKADPTETSTWTREGCTLRLLPPDRARGLEFDGVVVVEPAEFPENVGRLGVLYTALTRANRHLTVVYNRALPGGMKARP